MAIARAHRSQSHYPVFLVPGSGYVITSTQVSSINKKAPPTTAKLGSDIQLLPGRNCDRCLRLLHRPGRSYFRPVKGFIGGRSPSTVPACKLKRGFRSVAEVSKVYRQVLAVATSQPVERFPFPTGTDCSSQTGGGNR